MRLGFIVCGIVNKLQTKNPKLLFFVQPRALVSPWFKTLSTVKIKMPILRSY